VEVFRALKTNPPIANATLDSDSDCDTDPDPDPDPEPEAEPEPEPEAEPEADPEAEPEAERGRATWRSWQPVHGDFVAFPTFPFNWRRVRLIILIILIIHGEHPRRVRKPAGKP
jgi:hypothetical protein